MDQSTRESDRELWNPAIHWLLNISPAELGAKGTLGSTISALEHGGEATGVPNTEMTNYDVGWCAGDSPSEKWRKHAPVWFSLGLDTQGVLLAHYMPRNDLPDAPRVAVDGAMGKLANASLWVHEGEKLTKLIEACVNKGMKGRGPIIKNATKRTDERVREAHRIWAAVAFVGPAAPVDARTVITGPTAASRERWAVEYEMRLKERVQWAPKRAVQEQLDAALGMVRGLRALYQKQPPETGSLRLPEPESLNAA